MELEYQGHLLRILHLIRDDLFDIEDGLEIKDAFTRISLLFNHFFQEFHSFVDLRNFLDEEFYPSFPRKHHQNIIYYQNFLFFTMLLSYFFNFVSKLPLNLHCNYAFCVFHYKPNSVYFYIFYLCRKYVERVFLDRLGILQKSPMKVLLVDLVSLLSIFELHSGLLTNVN